MPNPIPMDLLCDPTVTASTLTAADANDRSSEKLLDPGKFSDVVRELSQPCPWRVAWAITVQWLVIAVAIVGAVTGSFLSPMPGMQLKNGLTVVIAGAADVTVYWQ